MTTLMRASNEWASRPDDERFVSLTEMGAKMRAVKKNSRSIVLNSRKIKAEPLPNTNNKGLVIVGPSGVPTAPSNWAFSQLCARVKAPADYLSRLPAPMAADCINYGLLDREVEDIGVYLQRDLENGEVIRTSAVTGPNYGRIHNADYIDYLIQKLGNGTGTDGSPWKVPGEFGKSVPITKRNTTLFASDRDFFAFVADESKHIEIANRRNHESGALSRGIFAWNSEVGAKTCGFAFFLFDYVCQNRIVWGVKGYQEVSIRHTSGGPERFEEKLIPALQTAAIGSMKPIEDAIVAAQARKLDKVDEFLAARFGKTNVDSIKVAHMQDEARPIETLWDAITGATAWARGFKRQESRLDVEREAGELLAKAA